MPFSFVIPMFRPPNSLAVVRPTGTAPPSSRRRSSISDDFGAIRSRNTSEASVDGHPASGSSSFTPTGTPPNGALTSASRAASNARSGSRNENALRSLASIAAKVASSSSTGDRSLARNVSTSEHASPSHGESDIGGRLLGVAEQLSLVLLQHSLRRLEAPRLHDELAQLADLDLLQVHEDGRIAVVVGCREELLRVGLQHR